MLTGQSTATIAKRLRVSPTTVCKWRTRASTAVASQLDNALRYIPGKPQMLVRRGQVLLIAALVQHFAFELAHPYESRKMSSAVLP